ncbi:MAG: hypothetical protein AAFP70_00240 [Calditrichota bacterium]
MKRILMLTLALLLVAGFAVNCSDRGSSAMSSDVAAELANLPSDVRGVAYMNMDKLRSSPMFSSIKDSMEKRLDDASDYQEMFEETGLDVRADVNELLVAFTNPDGDIEKSGLVIAKGSYDPERIMNFVKKKDTENRLGSESYKEHTLYIPTNDDNRFCFADRHRIVAGDKELVKAWLDNFSDESTTFKNTALNSAIADLRFKDTFWAVLDAASMMDEMMAQMSDEAMDRMPAIKSIQEVHMSMDVSKNLKVDGRGHFDNSDNALLFHDALKGMMAMVKLSMGSDRDAMDVINKIDVQQNESDVKFFMEMTRADLDKLMEKRRQGFAAIDY